MGFYERLLEEASREKRSPASNEEVSSYEKVWRHPAHEAGGYLTVEDLEQERLQRNWMKVRQEEEKRSKEIRVLRAVARQGVHSPVQGIAFKTLQRKYPAEWDRIRWG